MYDEIKGYNTRGYRDYDCIIIDEADNAMIDKLE